MATDFDYGQLDAIAGGDAEFEREVIGEYIICAPRDLAKLRAAVTAGDAVAISATAHALKGASATLGARGFAASALVIEQAGKKGDLELARGSFARLEAELTDVLELMRQRLSKAA
jgi:HPt (histidine-containing phosphotransfer) domain-containing protein